MPNAPQPAADSTRPRVDVRRLSLAQLQKMAEQGSRRARAELEGRMRAAGATPPAPAPAAPPPVAAPQPRPDLSAQIELLALQDSQRARADGPPRLVGMVLIAWSALILLGALAMLAHGGGPYYLFCALGAAAVGGLLMRRSRWALALHGALLLVALGWAWRGAGGSLVTVLVQAAPLLVPAAWMAVRPVREPLE